MLNGEVLRTTLAGVQMAKSRVHTKLTGPELDRMVEALVANEARIFTVTPKVTVPKILWYGLDNVNGVVYSDPKKGDVIAAWAAANNIPKDAWSSVRIETSAYVITYVGGFQDTQVLNVISSTALAKYGIDEAELQGEEGEEAQAA